MGTFQVKERDQQLLDELLLSPVMSVAEVESRVAALNMRQLDRLKLMFLRIQSDESAFRESTLKGIISNELTAYTQALFTMWKATGEEPSAARKDKA